MPRLLNPINTFSLKILDKYNDVESKKLLREMIKMEICSKTIQQAKKRRFKLKRKELELQERIKN